MLGAYCGIGALMPITSVRCMDCLLKYLRPLVPNRTLLIGSLLVSLSSVAMAHGQAEAVPAKPAKKVAKAAPAPAPKLYSAERSLTRQAKLARARAAAMAREAVASQP